MGGPLLHLGYEGRSLDDVVALLLEHHVATLVDVRLTSRSRKPSLSKTRLSAALAEAGVRYVHLPELGNPRDNRDGFRRGDPASRRAYAERLDRPAARHALTSILELLERGPVALFCVEQDPDTCHRLLVAQRLVAMRRAVHVVAVG